MMLLLGLLALATVLEALLVRTPSRAYRPALSIVVVVLSVFSSTALLIVRWPVWLGVWVLNLYRFVNIARVAAGRLPDKELEHVAVRAYHWLVVLQVLIAIISWSLVELPGFRHDISLIVPVVQALIAISLLRSTLRTWNHTKLPQHVDSLADRDLPTLSVLIPARNETDVLQDCLASLVASDYPKLEVIVLDDRSVTKRTPEIIRMFAHDGVRFVKGDEPDQAVWLPKNQAYERLADEASGEILLFCGVDIRFEPHTLRLLVETMLSRKKKMLSTLPLRAIEAQSSTSVIQPMRYFWELALPRRFFNRPPVLSSCWLITAEALKGFGSFKAVTRMVVPEAYFARQLTVTDGYSFLRSNFRLGLSSVKSIDEQLATAIRTRYPQLHKRIDLVALISLVELFVFLGPPVVLVLAWLLHAPYRVVLTPFAVLAYMSLLAVYYRIVVRTKLNSRWLAWLLFPFAVFSDVVLLHISMWQYEFMVVEWKGRNITVPVMRLAMGDSKNKA